MDLEDWPVIEKWMEGVSEALLQLDLPTAMDYLDVGTQEDETGVSRTRPFSAQMMVTKQSSISLVL